MQFSKETTFNIWYVVAAVFGVLLIQHFWIESQRVEPIPYSEFERYLDDGKINNIVVGNQFIRGYFKEPRDGRTQPDPAVLAGAIRTRPARAAAPERRSLGHEGRHRDHHGPGPSGHRP